MELIYSSFCANNTPHESDAFISFNPNVEYRKNEHLLMFFKTPFLYSGDGGIKECEAFHYILFPPQTSAGHGSYKEGFINDWIFFTKGITDKIISDFNLPIGIPFEIDNHSIIEPFIKRIENEKNYKHKYYQESITQIIIDMLITLGRKYELAQKNTHRAFKAINDTRNYMLNHIDEKITVKLLARRANFSPSRFSILYNEFFSATPIDDLLNARIEKALSLLKFGEISVTEVATLCGFSSIHYFSRKFKERTGFSPSHYIDKP